MDQKQALEELRTIRAVMEQTQRAVYQQGGGWITVMWGCVWILGFTGTQFLSPEVAGWVWLGLSAPATGGTIFLLLRRRGQVTHPLFWRRIVFIWWAALGFASLLWWLLGLDTRQGTLLLVMMLALVYILLGLFVDPPVSLAGLLLAAIATGIHFLQFDYFHLVMGFVAGGTIIAVGLWTSYRWGR